MGKLKTLSYDELISDYANRVTNNKLAVDATALRTESKDYRDLHAYLATDGKLTYNQIRELILHKRSDIVESEVIDPLRLASLGRVALLQKFEADDARLGIACLELAAKLMPRKGAPRRFRRLLAQNAILEGDRLELNSLLERFPDLDREFHGYLRAELHNPFVAANAGGSRQEWLLNFNRPFIEAGLQPVELNGSGPTAFDLLTTETRTSTIKYDTPLVSVVLTTFQPDEASLTTSVSSILDQSWHNLELIIVDDASGEDYSEIIQKVAASDDRIKLITCPINGGTYKARNAGYEIASGEFITGQDDDDWSHPQRVQLQVETLMENPKAPASRARAISCGDELNRVRLDYQPEGPNASSLMIRRDMFEKTGGFLPIRKAADNEFAQRIEIIAAEPIIEVGKPLSLIRIQDGSLSRSHFKPGWQHPSRRQFKSAYGYWHRSARKSDLRLSHEGPPPVAIPRALRDDPSTFPHDLDIVFAGDWRQFGGPQKSMMEEIKALKKAGYKVGILHLEAARFMSVSIKPLCDPIQRLINDGIVEEVLYDDPVDIELLVLRYPPILQFRPNFGSDLKAKQLIVLANQAPAELDGTDVRYIVPDCDNNATFMFGLRPLWVPQGPQVRDAISVYSEDVEIAYFDIPGLIDFREWHCDRSHPRSSLPVVGRHSRDNVMKWPSTEKELRAVYPTDGEFDIRILGGAKVPIEILGSKSNPAGWTVYGTNEISPRQFLHSLDFYVFYPHEHSIEAFGRAILEAIASGLVVILPPIFERVFGEGAVYRKSMDVRSTVRFFQEHPDQYRQQSQLAVATVEEKFSHSMYEALIAELLHGGAQDRAETHAVVPIA